MIDLMTEFKPFLEFILVLFGMIITTIFLLIIIICLILLAVRFIMRFDRWLDSKGKKS